MNDKNQKTENEMRDNHAEMNKRVQYTWLKETLAQHEPTFIDMDQCHQAAVCIPLLKNQDSSYDVLFEAVSYTHLNCFLERKFCTFRAACFVKLLF